MNNTTNQIQFLWQSMENQLPSLSYAHKNSLRRWLMGTEPHQWENLPQQKLAIAVQGVAYRYKILRKHYLGVTPVKGYHHLFNRLGLALLKSIPLSHWVKKAPQHQRTLLASLQSLIEEILKRDVYLQQQQKWIAQCSQDISLCNGFLLTTLEEYCLYNLGDRPLILYLLSNFLYRQQKKQHLTPQQQELLDILAQEGEPADFGGLYLGLPPKFSQDCLDKRENTENFKNYLESLSVG